MLKPALLILSFLMTGVAFAAGPPMKITDYPNTNSLSSNRLFLVAAPSTNFNISFGQLKAQIIDPTNVVQQWITNPVTGAVTNLNAVSGNNIAIKGEAIQFSAGSSTITESSGHLQFSSGGSQAITAAAGSFYSGSGSGLTDVPVGVDSILASDQTTTSASLASTTLSVTLVSSGVYEFKAIFYLSDSVTADGASVDFGGGSATATTFIAEVVAYDTALNFSSRIASITTASTASAFNGNGMFEATGTIFVNSGGTFIPRFAQAAHSTGTLTLAKGSRIRCIAQ